ncbi:hypothetical protein IJ103_01035 [Candidatus Saccharibacteria bacterium]|nr:hypothetical protein [Candidatus Saccharibacteria bacterium]
MAYGDVVRADVSRSGKEVRIERHGTQYAVYYNGQQVYGLTNSYDAALSAFTRYMAV